MVSPAFGSANAPVWPLCSERCESFGVLLFTTIFMHGGYFRPNWKTKFQITVVGKKSTNPDNSQPLEKQYLIFERV